MANNGIFVVVLTEDKVLNDLPRELERWITCWNHDGFFVLGIEKLFPWGTVCCNTSGHYEYYTAKEIEAFLAKAAAITKALEEQHSDIA